MVVRRVLQQIARAATYGILGSCHRVCAVGCGRPSPPSESKGPPSNRHACGAPVDAFRRLRAKLQVIENGGLVVLC